MKVNVKEDICTGCKLCENTCSFFKTGNISPKFSRIKIEHQGEWALPIIKTCRHCDEPACVEVCPTGAMYKAEDNNVVLLNQDSCIGCGICVDACQYNAIRIDLDSQTVIKCDTCNGEFNCVSRCVTKALSLNR